MKVRCTSTAEPPLPFFAFLEAPYGTANAVLGFVASSLLTAAFIVILLLGASVRRKRGADAGSSSL